MRHIEVSLDAIPADAPLRVEDGRHGIVVVRTGGRLSAFEDVCPHAQWRLSDGDIIGGVLECPGHGWEFNLETGRCVNVPAYCLKAVAISRCGNVVRLALAAESDEVPLAVKNRDDQAVL